MPITPIKTYNDPVSCYANHYVDKAIGEAAHGPWHATEKEAQADKKNVEASAENNAFIKAQGDAGNVLDRDCPGTCPVKTSDNPPDPPQASYRPADVYESGLESEAGKGWRWHAKATCEWDVLFVCRTRAAARELGIEA